MFPGPGMLLATVFFTNYCRIIQYSSKFVSWAMIQRGLSEDLVDKIKALERSVSTARKCEFMTLLQGSGEQPGKHWRFNASCSGLSAVPV